ncbi:aminoglycoside 3-N-acetyltransferase [Pontibacillus chungwhensis BH030062]|uniref:Aminoglycoside N(3)-acetyltransferase n=1 Tax=Pontibacillus chungwhensis BH030062 TaxID=1385513 RepID=A0A0A2URM8_9BACI|nr:AAC(3) family N-acetyltransferase [Pontibacillus chungwhensis]KGP90599.1 aminoglycoside 3-N-acetyltransferase [Pontibacillus chungwhensis BH030062]
MNNEKLITKKEMMHDLRKLGVRNGMTVIVHSSLKSIGRVIGGPVSVILALQDTVGTEGNIVMPTQSEQLCDPMEYESGYTEEEIKIIRDHMPIYYPDLTPTAFMGFIPETFRKQQNVYRSSHPHTSFSAWGKKAKYITDHHNLDFALNENSPLGRIYDLNGYILLLGAPTDSNTSLHLAEYRQENTFIGEKIWDVKVEKGNKEEWTTYKDINNESDDFDKIFTDFRNETNYVVEGSVGEAKSYFIPMKEMVDFAVKWMNKNRA